MLQQFEYGTKSPVVPSFTINVHRSNFDAQKTAQLVEVVVNEEQYLLETYKKWSNDPSDLPQYDNFLTNRGKNYNLFDFSDKYPVLNDLKLFIREQYNDYCSNIGIPVEQAYIQCWGNIIRNDGNRIIKHEHSDANCGAPQEYANISGFISVQAENTNTYFQHPVLPKVSIPVKNVPSDNILFPSWMIHWTDKNPSTTPRISIAYDIITQYVYDNYNTENFRPL